MNHTFTLGETVLDILFRNGTPVSSIAGGSMLNTAVALGRMGCQVDFISEYGNDEPGKIIEQSLAENNVFTRYSERYDNFSTSVALAFLDEYQNASYTFYHNQPEELRGTTGPVVTPGDILAFGSFYSVKPSRRQHVRSIVQSARKSDAFIIFDPNVRQHHLADMPAVRDVFFENMLLSHIVKGSVEDFEFLSGTSDPSKNNDLLKSFCSYMIVTQGDKNVLLFTPGFQKSYQVQLVNAVSTIGAGDNFTAGLVYGLLLLNRTTLQPAELSIEEWDKLIGYGIAFATATCLSMENYIPKGFKPEF